MAASLFAEYAPNRVVASWKGIPLLGYADGTFIQVERAEDAYSMSVGAGGDVVRVKNLNRTGTVTFTLQASSPSNDLLSAQAIEDELFSTGVGPLLIKDLNGTTLVQAPIAWVRKIPNMEYSKDAGDREWMIDCADLIPFVGGSTTVVAP